MWQSMPAITIYFGMKADLKKLSGTFKTVELSFGAFTNTGACEVECPKNISLSNIALSNIARLNREFLSAKFND